jgi:hypothetical protein
MRFLDSVGHNSNWLHICIPQKLPKINHYAVKNSYQGLSIGTKIGNFWSVYHLATPCGRTARYVTSQLDKPQILFLLLGIHRAYCLVRKKVKIFYGLSTALSEVVKAALARNSTGAPSQDSAN